MSSPTSLVVDRPAFTTLGIGLVAGALIAFGFALIIQLLPGSVFTDTGPRVVIFILGAVTSPTIVLPLWVVARRIAVDPRFFAWSAISGALLFDGTAIGFVPDLYGQTGDALTFVAAALLWTFGCNAVTELVVEKRPTT